MTELRDPAEVFAAEIGWQPALERTDLLAEPVAAALRALLQVLDAEECPSRKECMIK